jgi:hypothetical protein
LRRHGFRHARELKEPPLTTNAIKRRPGIVAAARLATLATLAVGLLALAGCGESAQADAKKQVCATRGDLVKQITTLAGLTLSSGSANAAKASFEAIGRDVTQIKAAQSRLGPPLKRQVETATSNFVAQVNAIASGLTSKLSPSNAAAQFKSALGQLANAYNQTLGAITCA